MKFDAPAKGGEIRIFAETKDPLVALVLDDRGLSGFRIVPVSPYRIPVSDAEMTVGERVFQLWNACTASRRLVESSWIVDTLDEASVASVRTAVARTANRPPSRLGDYERRTLAVGGDFRSWRSRCPKADVPWWRRHAAWSVAASVVIGLGVAWLAVQEPDVRATCDKSARVLTVRMERAQKFAPLEAPEPDVVAEAAVPETAVPDVKVEMPVPEVPTLDGSVVRSREPVGKRIVEMAAQRGAKLRSVRADAVVTKRATAGDREAEVRQSLRRLVSLQASDGSWGPRTLRDTGLAVLALLAHGEKGDSAAYGECLRRGARYLSTAKVEGANRLDAQIAACALAGASVSVRNPNLREAAERVLASIGDHRSVDSARDWSGLLTDLSGEASAVQGVKSAGHDAAPPGDDPVADMAIFVLQLLRR